MSDVKWKDLDARLGGWARERTAGLDEEQVREVWLATVGLLRRPSGRPDAPHLLSAETAFEAALQRLREALAGDERSAQAFGRLVHEGYLADRDEHLAEFISGLDGVAWREVAALACLAHRQDGLPPRDAALHAHRVAYDRTHHPDPAIRGAAARTLGAVRGQVEASAALRQAVTGFIADHLRALDGPLRAC